MDFSTIESLTELAHLESTTRSPLPETVVPAMAYVPYQQPGKQYSTEQAIEKGTLFPVLNKPFKCGREVQK